MKWRRQKGPEPAAAGGAEPAGVSGAEPAAAGGAAPVGVSGAESVGVSGARLADAVAAGTSRRGFLARVGAAAMSLAGVASLAGAREAEAYHFCGHIYTTDSCPHPTGLPRIDRKGYPLKARDGRPVDDLGRYVDALGFPVDDEGAPLTDADGVPLPKATRTKVCDAVGDEYGFKPHVDGAWYRCCNGRVRKLVDCCGTMRRRINGDRALKGYCYRGRKVFCVMYYDTNTKC